MSKSIPNEKHIELVQNIITRMNTNSFLLKGWQVMIVSALFVLAGKDSNMNFAYIAYLPSISFWILDAFYLRQERLYRYLYNAIIEPKSSILPFSMNASIYSDKVDGILKTCISTTLLLYHGPIFLIVNIVTAVLIWQRHYA